METPQHPNKTVEDTCRNNHLANSLMVKQLSDYRVQMTGLSPCQRHSFLLPDQLTLRLCGRVTNYKEQHYHYFYYNYYYPLSSAQCVFFFPDVYSVLCYFFQVKHVPSFLPSICTSGVKTEGLPWMPSCFVNDM